MKTEQDTFDALRKMPFEELYKIICELCGLQAPQDYIDECEECYYDDGSYGSVHEHVCDLQPRVCDRLLEKAHWTAEEFKAECERKQNAYEDEHNQNIGITNEEVIANNIEAFKRLKARIKGNKL